MDEDRALEEALRAVGMPEAGTRRWLSHVRRKCERHGGRRVYAGLLELLDRCEAALEDGR